MEFHEQLIRSIQNNIPQEALYYTGELAKTGHIEVLESSWFYMVSCLASFSHFSYKKWSSICSDLLNIIKNESFYITDAFLLTIKLCVMYKDCGLYFTLPKYQIATLRNKVIGFFKDELKLSDKGLSSFKHLLPKNESEREFCIKTLSGLLSLWGEKKSIEFRNALEYIDRKHFDIEVPSDIHIKWGPNHYPFNIFLWECLCVVEPSLDVAKQLYQYQYSKKNHNNYFSSFMLATHTILQDSYNQSWTQADLELFDRIRDISTDLSNQIIIETPNATNKESDLDNFVFERFFPTTYEKIDESPNFEPLSVHTKTIVLNKKDKAGSKNKEKEKEKKYKDIKDTKVKVLPYV